MRRCPRRPGVLAAGVALAVVVSPVVLPLSGRGSARGAVTIAFSDKDSTPTTATIPQGQQLNLAVFLNQSAGGDDVSGLDYRIKASASGDFRIRSRTSTAALTPYADDTSSSVAPVTLSPDNGTTNLGGLVPTGQPDLTGVRSTEIAEYNLLVLSTTPIGSYTISFAPVGMFTMPTYEGGYPSYPTTPVAGETDFTLTVAAAPEPATAATVLGSTAGLLLGVRRPRRRTAG